MLYSLVDLRNVKIVLLSNPVSIIDTCARNLSTGHHWFLHCIKALGDTPYLQAFRRKFRLRHQKHAPTGRPTDFRHLDFGQDGLIPHAAALDPPLGAWTSPRNQTRSTEHCSDNRTISVTTLGVFETLMSRVCGENKDYVRSF